MPFVYAIRLCHSMIHFSHSTAIGKMQKAFSARVDLVFHFVG
jgi:hypothetical protein